MNEKKLKGMLGLAVRARQAVLGWDACRNKIVSGSCGLVLLDSSISKHTRKKAEDLCRNTGTPTVTLPAGLIEEATGRSNMIAALEKGSFSEQVTGCLQTGGEP